MPPKWVNSVGHVLSFGVWAANGFREVWGEPKLKKIASLTLPKWRKLLHQRFEKPYFTEKLRVSSLLFSSHSSLLFSSLLFSSLLFSSRLVSSLLFFSPLLFSSRFFSSSLLFSSLLLFLFASFVFTEELKNPLHRRTGKTCFREMSKNLMCLGSLLFSSLLFFSLLFCSLLELRKPASEKTFCDIVFKNRSRNYS